MNWNPFNREPKAFSEPEVALPPTPRWQDYRAGLGDKSGREITRVYAFDDHYVIYFIGSDLYYELDDDPDDLGSADAALARINRLLDSNPRQYKKNEAIMELAGDAMEMFFWEEKTEAIEILNSLAEKLKAREEARRRLQYQEGTFFITALAWIIYLLFLGKAWMDQKWEPWFLAAVLAMAGGLFSVCLKIGSLEVNVNQERIFLLVAGATRSVVALLAGTGLLLAMRSKMFAGITYDKTPPEIGAGLTAAEMFFCFLAGFSESFVPNILSKATETKDKDKAASDKACAEKAAADKAAAEKTAREKAAADKAAAEKSAGH